MVEKRGGLFYTYRSRDYYDKLSFYQNTEEES